MEKKPIKREKALQPLSRDHHHALLLSWKIRQGLKRDIAPERIMSYAREFFNQSLKRHFYEEEKFLFPLLGLEHPLIKKACKEHRRLKRLFFTEKNFLKASSLIEEELEAHIRFEELGLFKEIQKKAAGKELRLVAKKLHVRSDNPPLEEWSDPFWLGTN